MLIPKSKRKREWAGFRCFLLTERFVSWEIAKVLNYALFEEAISGSREVVGFLFLFLPFMLQDITNDSSGLNTLYLPEPLWLEKDGLSQFPALKWWPLAHDFGLRC